MIKRNNQFDKLNQLLTDRDKKLVIVSDFDDTLVSNYRYNPIRKAHCPVLRKEIRSAISLLKSKFSIPLIICSARGVNDRVIKTISDLCHNPVVIENGGAIYFKNKVQLLITKQEQKTVQKIKKMIKNNLRSLNDILPNNKMELLVRLDRGSDIEFRIQHSGGKGLNNSELNLYDELNDRLMEIIKDKRNRFRITFTGSSLSIRLSRISKVSGLSTVFKLLKLKRETVNIIALGDNENDKELMSFADYATSVGQDKIKNSDLHLGDGEKGALTLFNYLVRNL